MLCINAGSCAGVESAGPRKPADGSNVPLPSLKLPQFGRTAAVAALPSFCSGCPGTPLLHHRSGDACALAETSTEGVVPGSQYLGPVTTLCARMVLPRIGLLMHSPASGACQAAAGLLPFWTHPFCRCPCTRPFCSLKAGDCGCCSAFVVAGSGVPLLPPRFRRRPPRLPRLFFPADPGSEVALLGACCCCCCCCCDEDS